LLDNLEVHYLEDMRTQIGKGRRLSLLAAVRVLPAGALYALFGKPVSIEQPAAIIFTGGSEGEAKGVVLSHRNIMGNIRQVSDVLDTREADVVMASLPLCHALGLTVTGLMPLVEGIPVVCHADPGDALRIAQTIGKYRATLFCSTSTFLRLFVRNPRIHPLMLASLRLVVAGAERLGPEVRDEFKLKFNKDIYEGYGTTETTPVASVNIPDRIDPRNWKVQEGSRPGSVGLPLPGSSFRIVDPRTLQTLPQGEDGLILIGGTQVMLGYLDDPQRTAEAIVELDGKRWYKSGDRGHLDRDGFLTLIADDSRLGNSDGGAGERTGL
jgi:acyl-[acyl-carrier-protein]-phospholipid O-acyltransferase/long-chain-fatty-acid--[acyl-carrier-protein] ligase